MVILHPKNVWWYVLETEGRLAALKALWQTRFAFYPEEFYETCLRIIFRV
jgi:hypothetical protein